MQQSRHLLAITVMLLGGAGWACAQSNGGAAQGTTGGAGVTIVNGSNGSRPAAQGATGGASVTLNPSTTNSSAAPGARPPIASGPGVAGTTSTTGQASPTGRPCNPAAVGATGGATANIITVPENTRTQIASDRNGTNVNSVPLVSGGTGVTPGC